MSEILDIRSKKGMSLAYVLVVSLFLMMITGGIVSMALMQHNETGSDLNVRQAYISAKSGLDTMQDSLKNKVITGSELPIAEGGEMYYIMFVDSSDPTGQIQYQYATSEDAIKTMLATIEADTTKTIIGGEGTYFKIKKTGSQDYKVTALNTTGKYNNNTTLNQGDLSVGVAVYETFTFGNPQPDPTEAPSYYVLPDGSGSNDFLMVGQQTAVNEKRSSSDSSAYKTLNSMHQINSGGSGGGAGKYEIYVLDTQANADVSSSYAPLVYDKTVRLTSSVEHSQVAAYNEGIYLLGNATGDEINDYAFVDGNRKNLGQTSFFTQNSDYAPEFSCTFMVISHHIVTVDHSPKINYYGNKGRNFVYVYLENNVKFHMCRSDNKTYDDSASFTKTAGWYKFYTDKDNHMYNPNSWVKCSAPSESELGCKNHLARIRSILDAGDTLHSGGPETQKKNVDPNDVNVNILGWNGLYDGSKSSPEGEGINRAHVYCSPCKAPYTAETYTWNAKEFNLYWTGLNSFTLTNGAKIVGQGEAFVVTMANNNIIKQGGSAEVFKIESNKLCMMGDVVVEYGSKSYEIKKGTYNIYQVIADGSKPEADPATYQKKIADEGGINLFSDTAKEFFDACYAIPEAPAAPESHTGVDIDPSSGDITIDQTQFDSVTGEYIIPKEATGRVIYKQPLTDSAGNVTHHVIQVSGTYTIKRELADGTVIDLIKFEHAGKYKIPITTATDEATVGIVLDGHDLQERANWAASNYDCLGVVQKTQMSDKGYY